MERDGKLIEDDQLEGWRDADEDENGRCPECGKPMEPDETVCANCGAEFGFFCPECDREIPSDADVCPYCGAELDEGFEDEARAAIVVVERVEVCGNCGEPIGPDDVECSHCGVDLCPDCGTALDEEDVVCPNCGAEFVFSCPECDREIPTDADVCPYCGAELEEDGEEGEDALEEEPAVTVERADFCGNCGQAIGPDELECPNCGIDLCPDCAAPLDEEDVVCPNCGATFVFSCPECGKEVPADADECPHCGLVFELEDEDE